MKPIFITHLMSAVQLNEFLKSIDSKARIEWQWERSGIEHRMIVRTNDDFQNIVDNLIKLKPTHDKIWIKTAKTLYSKDYVVRLTNLWELNFRLWNKLKVNYEL